MYYDVLVVVELKVVPGCFFAKETAAAFARAVCAIDRAWIAKQRTQSVFRTAPIKLLLTFCVWSNGIVMRSAPASSLS